MMKRIRIFFGIIQVMSYMCFVRPKKDNSLTARTLLETIAPTYKQTKLPPGFPSLDTINADKFDYKTSGNLIRVTANLDRPVTMFPEYIRLSNVKMKFTFDKKEPRNSKWDADIKASWAIGSTILHVNITPNGKLLAFEDSFDLHDIVSEFLKKDGKKDIGIDVSAISLENVTISAEVTDNMNGMRVSFSGKLSHNSLDAISIKVAVNKFGNSKMQLFSVMEFKHVSPEKVFKKLMNQKTLNIPFFAHMLASSHLFSTEKEIFGIAFSYNELYYYKENTMSGDILASVLQSHIPVGVTLLCPLKIDSKKLNTLSDTIKIAFVINRPVFDLLIDQNDKIPVKELLPALSKEFSTSSNNVPDVITDLDEAFTTHVSFDSSSTMFSIFVRLHETVDLVPKLLRIKVTNLVLQRNMGLDSKKQDWKISAKGIYKMGKTRLSVQYSELSDEVDKPYGLTGIGKQLSLDDIILEFDPNFYPNPETQEMIENTELENLKLHNVKLYSRVSRKNGTPHMLITGYTNLPAWERDIQMALLLLYKNKTWECKWAASLKHSPLSNIIQAFTGFDSRDLKLLHNGHIMTTLISSPLPSFSLLPAHIITTPLLRLPVKKALTVIALLRFPDNCGDDKMCGSAAAILDPTKIYTVKGVLSMEEFDLKAKIPYELNLSKEIKGSNNTLQFIIGNHSKLEIITSLKIPRSDLVFDGVIRIYKTGQIQLQLSARKKLWLSPFHMKGISFENLELTTFYESESDLDKLKMEGKVRLGSQENNDGITAPLRLAYNPTSPSGSNFYANFTNITLKKLLTAFAINIQLPSVLQESNFPSGLMLSYSGKGFESSSYKLHGEVKIFGRQLNCDIFVHFPGNVKIITENSPAPVIFAKGQIIIQQDAKKKLRGPKIVASINHKNANVTVKGFAKILGIESDVDIELHDNGIRFSVTGKLMEYKDTKLTAYSTGSTDSFQVFGCLQDVAAQVQQLLLEIIAKSANQSIVNMQKAEQNFLNAQKYYEIADHEEVNVRNQRDRARVFYEEHLLDYGRYEVKANDTCMAPKCNLKCFGCPKLNKCCRLDIFGHCIVCSSWKSCCWKNINPLCISKHDGCHVIKAVAERDLAEREAQIIQQRIILDNLEQHVTKSEVNKGKHKAVLEAAIDAKQIVEEDSSPGLNAHDAVKNFGSPYGWVKINSVCYNTSLEQVSTGCMNFQVASELFKRPEKNITIWSCLKEDLVTEITESLANFIFPNIIDTSSDSVTEVATKLNSAEIESHLGHPIDIVFPPMKGAQTVTFPQTGNNKPEIVQENDYETQTEVPEQLGAQIDIADAPNNNNSVSMHPSQSTSQNNNDHSLLDMPPEEGEYESNPYLISSKTPPNAISPNGKPQVKLIDVKKVGGFLLPASSGSGEGSASGENPDNEQLKEIYDKETESSGEDDTTYQKNNGGKKINKADKSSKNRARKDKEISAGKEMIAEQIVEQEEIDEEDNEVNASNNKTNKNNKSNKTNTKVIETYNENKKKGEKIKNNSSEKLNKTQMKINFPNIYPDGLNGNSYGYVNQTSKQNNYTQYKVFPTTANSKYASQPGLKSTNKVNNTTTPNSAYSSNVGLVNQASQQIPSVPVLGTYNNTKLPTFSNQKTRTKRNIGDVIKSKISTPVSIRSHRLLFSNPFWDVKSDRSVMSVRSLIPLKPHRRTLMGGVIHKRWKIPENANGRCHIFHQLIAICKDMAETIIMLDKSLKVARDKFLEEDKDHYLELFETEEFLVDSAKRVNVSGLIMEEAGKTLGVVRQGVNIWSKRCSNEFDWQNQGGVQTWLQAMDLRIQELGGYGVYRFLENLFHAFEALFGVLTYSDTNTAKDALALLQRIRRISGSFNKIFKEKLSVSNSRAYANDILLELGSLRKDSMFCSPNIYN